MKRFLTSIFVALICLAGPRWAFAAWMGDNILNVASFTATNDSTVTIYGTLPGSVLVGVVTASGSSTGFINVFDSSGSTQKQIGKLWFTAPGANYFPFQVRLSSGLCYTTVGNTQGVTFIYTPGRP